MRATADKSDEGRSRQNSALPPTVSVGVNRLAHSATFARYDGPVPISSVMPRLMKTLKKPHADVIVTVFKRWEQVVGADIAQHCRPVAIDANRLIVATSDPMWASELEWFSEKLLDKLAQLSGERRLDALIVRVTPHQGNSLGYQI